MRNVLSKLPLKLKVLNFLLILTPLIAYLEWGQNNSAFLIEAELEVFKKIWTNPVDVLHPFILIPLAGQIILLISLFQKTPNKRLSYIGVACSSLLMVFLFLIGILGLNFKIIMSTIPSLIIILLSIYYLKRQNIS
jgi:hypothetical protein